ncbi:hypothetical protein BO82DRAFT_123537 [Aspergillus uvarum CBS 121591]|uniref:Uncharacterized protein n=1 Tax=Aspergillus uvarum CBS 121591 TaxID=1448315 RepID=A0A319C7G1_9EURO|nr:hypothetical protein BO82DRAFT_123537 [Aspergillus uvarum CBS 121591]PYH79807.1 hypothetical protein BO82DRAFT_123537 [Aspergillus uvarum CBS 121591]
MEGGPGESEKQPAYKDTMATGCSFLLLELELTLCSSRCESTRYPKGNRNHVREDGQGSLQDFPRQLVWGRRMRRKKEEMVRNHQSNSLTLSALSEFGQEEMNFDTCLDDNNEFQPCPGRSIGHSTTVIRLSHSQPPFLIDDCEDRLQGCRYDPNVRRGSLS